METAGTILDLVGWWGWTGLVIAVPFLAIGIDRVDENARGSYIFRPLLLPGVVLLWPLVLWRWFVLETGRDNWVGRHRPPRRSHGAAAIMMAVTIPAIILVGIAIKQTWPADLAPVKLEAAE